MGRALIATAEVSEEASGLTLSIPVTVLALLGIALPYLNWPKD